MKLKEEEIKKVQAAGGMYQIDSAGSEKDESFEHILNDSAVPRSMPAVIRTKKAEERAKLASPSLAACTEPLNSIEQRALEHQKRQQWRQARYKSLEADSAAAEEVMLQVQQINSRLTNINEESFTSSSCSQLPLTGRVLQNDTSTNRSEYIDPITGAKTISIVETSITQREIDTTPLLQAVSSFTFVDDETSKRMNATAAVSP
ncbi:hypothetical protein AB6A40_002018 [Gnathostoma spinigerum]|uniref:Uncharacterized protein n=1 Tax=Gnathostoma spinigerum TaxID=75299 RepID=A0ABD6EAZ1_9BILA